MWIHGEKVESRDFQCCVIVMWPASTDIANIFALMGFTAALPAILDSEAISISNLRQLLCDDGLGYYQFIRDIHDSKQLPLLCEKLVDGIVDSGDVMLAVAFLKKYFTQLQEKEKTQFTLSLAKLVRRLGWARIGNSMIRAIDGESIASSVNRALEMSETLSDDITAHSAITLFAVKEAQSLAHNNPESLASLSSIELLWQHSHTLANRHPNVPQSIRNMFLQMDGKFLGSVVDSISKAVAKSRSQEQFTTFAAIVLRRRQWLINEVFECNKPFTWQILNSNFSYVSEIVDFLQGTQTSFEIDQCATRSEAHLLVARLRECIKAPITIEVVGYGQHALVKLEKVGGEFDTRRKEVPKYMAEIARLGNLLLLNENLNSSNATTGAIKSGTKRARVDEPEIVEID
ncbi:hypothetical protein GN958_ATG11436 [Phytophthora infestans]|uniref:Uncharacterized protein n=1 Tax=Phytophthora infestans TaxID=4787 RepID=A0A8S9UEN9_PHYIN|nr:hypothetical protein GN958_ATG11436 [Phytophthora infestans]